MGLETATPPPASFDHTDSTSFDLSLLEASSLVAGSAGGGCVNGAATKLQKVYRSYRTRRKLADSAVVFELWWQARDFARLSHSTGYFFDDTKPEIAASLNACKVSHGLSRDGKALKLAFQHWMEAIDPRHRYGHNLHFYYDVWCQSQDGKPFFYWLDIGKGKYVDLPECPRALLKKQCIKYLGPQELEHYEYIITEGKIIHKQSGEPLDTSQGPKGKKWIFVMSTVKKLYAGKKEKGVFQHSSFLAGGATIAAGRFTAENGVIKSIWAYSGHYKPSAENLSNFTSFLEENGVDLKEVEMDITRDTEASRSTDGYNELDNASDELDNACEIAADLPWQLLEEITNGFSEERKIGSGGYGVVYKGVYKNGEEIAVKKLYHMPGLDDKQFQNELQSLTRLRHPNIVRLVGKSYEEKEKFGEYEGKLVCAIMIDRVICLEYLHNGSLEKHLSDESSGLPLHKRYKIIKGICDGVKYLHECGIFHLDLKPANILLDKNMEPKIADFGLSRLFSSIDQSHTTRNFIGTRGYVPPEYIEKGKISNKFDVFSLGVIIIGIITGPDGYSKQSDMSSQDFIEQVLENWRNRPQEQWKESYFDIFYRLKICIEIALNCVETDRHKRPSIGDIICKLNESETMIEKSYKVLTRVFFCTIDVHPTEPWILTNHGYAGIQILNYWTKATVKSLELGSIFSGGYGPIKTAKFIARKQWFVVGGCDGSIHVYCYKAMQEVKGFVAHSCWVTSLAIHPTEPYVLSASDYELNIKLWDWEKCWECTRIFDMRSGVHEIAFNPKGTNTFATGYVDGRAEIWNLGSPDSSFTLDKDEYGGWCVLDYFARGDQQYLITACSHDGTAKIWDLQKKICIKTLDGHTRRVSAVCAHPDLPILMTASDGTVYLWNSATFRVQSTFNFGLGEVLAFGCIKGSRRWICLFYCTES